MFNYSQLNKAFGWVGLMHSNVLLETSNVISPLLSACDWEFLMWCMG
jgi:hypothetical protein